MGDRVNKNKFALTPPMGWNSYDYYDTTVNEQHIKDNAAYMAKHLKKYGWEYIVVDIEWYSYGAGSRRNEYQYIPFGKVEMDEFSRLLPCPERFPSSVNGKGFAPLAEYVHSLGLKFGIHIMRGIPRIAAHLGTGIKGTDKTASDIANAYSICPWNPDMYGLDVGKQEAQAYYDSLMELYAERGVDFVKCDDICRYDADTSEQEIIMLHRAISKCGRPIVLSLSPGPAIIDKAWVYEKYANMWRITDDLWDDWKHIVNMFDRCEIWQNHVSEGCYPDCDMIPFGMIGRGFGQERKTNLTIDEQVSLMTLWCIFRSPLMLGAELTQLDDETEKLLTNEKVLHLLKHSHGAKQLRRNEKEAVWTSVDDEAGIVYVALFNLGDEFANLSVDVQELCDSLSLDFLYESQTTIVELWSGKRYMDISDNIPKHGARLFRIEKQ